MTAPRRWTREELYRALNVHAGMQATQFWNVLHPSGWLDALDDVFIDNASLTQKQGQDYDRYTLLLRTALDGLGLPFEPPVEIETYDPLIHGMRHERRVR